MKKEILILRNMLTSLRDDANDSYDLGKYDICYYFIDEYNRLLNKVSKLEGCEIGHFVSLSYPTYRSAESTHLLKAISSINKLIAFLESIGGQSEEKIRFLKALIESQNQQINELKNKEDALLEISRKSRSSKAYPINEDKLRIFDPATLNLFCEALDSYSVGAYTACCCVGRNLIQHFVQRLCKENSIKEGSLDSQIKKLVEMKIIELEHHSELLDVVKFFGHRSAHPTTEVFSQEKANLMISTILILNEEIFSKKEKKT